MPRFMMRSFEPFDESGAAPSCAAAAAAVFATPDGTPGAAEDEEEDEEVAVVLEGDSDAPIGNIPPAVVLLSFCVQPKPKGLPDGGLPTADAAKEDEEEEASPPAVAEAAAAAAAAADAAASPSGVGLADALRVMPFTSRSHTALSLASAAIASLSSLPGRPISPEEGGCGGGGGRGERPLGAAMTSPANEPSMA